MWAQDKHMKRVAVLLDLGFVLYRLYKPLGRRNATADEIAEFAQSCVKENEELFRVYCYHCPPYAGTQPHPITRKPFHFNSTNTYKEMNQLIRELSQKDRIAFRAGAISFDGWSIRSRAAREIAKSGRSIEADDFKPDIKQKRVDIKIGLDVAWLASKSIVDRVVLVTADSDFIPAMKFARREGVQVVLVPMHQSNIKKELFVHADEVRGVRFPEKSS